MIQYKHTIVEAAKIIDRKSRTELRCTIQTLLPQPCDRLALLLNLPSAVTTKLCPIYPFVRMHRRLLNKIAVKNIGVKIPISS